MVNVQGVALASKGIQVEGYLLTGVPAVWCPHVKGAHCVTERRLIVSTEPLEQNPGDIMLAPEVVEFAAEALQSMGGRYTGEIEFSGRSARVARRMSTHRVSGVRPTILNVPTCLAHCEYLLILKMRRPA